MSKKEGFKVVGAQPLPEELGSSLGLFLPVESHQALSKLTKDEHNFLQSLLERLSASMKALQETGDQEQIERIMHSMGNEISAATKLKSLDRVEAQNLAINMVAAITATGVRSLMLTMLTQATRPKEPKKDEFIHKETVDDPGGTTEVETGKTV